MQSVKIKVFGTPEIWVDGNKIELPFKKAEGIVYYLAVEKKTTRDTLVNLFWCDVQDDIAKKNLRNAFYMIRKAMGLDLFSMPNRTFVELSRDVTIDFDYQRFIDNDVNAFQGEFLDGFMVKDAENFDTWAVQTKEQSRERYISWLYDLIQRTDDERLIKEYCNRILAFDEFDEAIYRRLMQVYLSQGRFNKSIELYRQLENLLKDELGIQPDQQSQKLFEEISLQKNEVIKESKTDQYKSNFYGRQEELKALRFNQLNLRKGHAHSLLLSGDAGIGKTAILSHFIDELPRSVVVLKAPCFQAEESFNLRPWDDIMRQLSKRLPELKEVTIPSVLKKILGHVFPTFTIKENSAEVDTEDKVDFIKNQLIDKAMYELFDLLADHYTLLFVFEDIHWIDPLSLSLIKQFIINEKNNRFYMVLTSRYTDSGQSERALKELKRHGYLEEMLIKNFTREETYAVLKPYVDLGKLNVQKMNQVYAETEGNALFLFEFANSLMDGEGQQELSPKIKDVLNSRILPLSEDARKVLNILSVFFDYAPLDQIIRTSEINELELADIIETLMQQKLIREITESSSELLFQFSHQKLREFIYNELSQSKRRILCRRVGQIIETTLSHNYSDRVRYPKLVHYFSQSGDHLLELKYRLAYLHDYLQLTHETFPIIYYIEKSELFTIPLSEEDILKELKVIEQLFENMHIAFSQQPLFNELKMEYLHIVGRYYIKVGTFDKGLQAIDMLMTLANEANHEAYLLKGYMQKIFYTINAHDLVNMKQYVDEALNVSVTYPLEHHVYMRLKGLYKVLIGQFDEGEALIRIALFYFKSINRRGEYTLNIAACYYYLGESQRLQGNYKASIDHFENAIALCKSKNLVGRLTIFYTHAGHAAFDLKDYERAQKFFEEATILYQTYDFRWGRSTACGFLGLLELMDGYYKEALHLFQSADAYALRLNNAYEQGILRRIKAEACHYLMHNRVRYVPILQYIGLDLSIYCDVTTLVYREEDMGFRKDVIERLTSLRDDQA
jgi:DNA-binding SARP family transcriptional activator